MLLLEMTGQAPKVALLEVFRSSESVQVVPYAVLGDFTLKVQLESVCKGRAEQIQGSLEGLGLQVLGYRWKV